VLAVTVELEPEMDLDQMAQHADPAFLGDYLAGLPRPEQTHDGAPRRVREDDFNGHRIVITTTYEITVDHKPLNVHIGLANDGSAHCHGLPAYQFLSVVDLVRTLIEYFPEDFPPAGAASGHQEHGAHGGHRPQGM
jgi:hypothetical protein